MHRRKVWIRPNPKCQEPMEKAGHTDHPHPFMDGWSAGILWGMKHYKDYVSREHLDQCTQDSRRQGFHSGLYIGAAVAAAVALFAVFAALVP